MDRELDDQGYIKPKALYTVPEYFGVLDELDEAREMLTAAQDDADYYKSIIDSYDMEPVSDSGNLTYIHAKDINVDLDQADFVQGILGHGQLSVVYGESNCGKTFFMTDLCFHIALGQEWRGKRVDGGGVVYVAMEGAIGLKKRVAAFRAHYKRNPDGFVMVPSPIDFMDPSGNIKEFMGLLDEAKRDLGSIRIVVIDTLARAIAGGDENSGQDMGMLVKHADMIRAKTGAHVCFIHHSGKDKLKGARGHSSLRAAIDTEIEISRDDGADYSTVRVVKQREMERGEDMAFKLSRVVLGVNNYGEEVSSCTVESYELEGMASKPKRAMNPHEQFVYDCLVNALISHGVTRVPFKGSDPVQSIDYFQLSEALEAAGYKDVFNADGTTKVGQVTFTARVGLKDKGLINFNRSNIWLLPRE